MSEKGYKNDFIGDSITINLPKFSPSLEGAVYKDQNIRDQIYLDFTHYTIVMNKTTKQLVFSASNLSQEKHIKIPRKKSKDWDLDSRIPENMQLDNRYYKSNDWDRGHMVQRKNNGWGNNYRKALQANDDTFFYTNAAFQHKFFNQDEWLKLEDFIGGLKEDSNGKLCVFTGPVHLQYDRQYARGWHDTVRIPSGFFKIVCYKSRTTKKLETKAFLLYQDNEFIGNKKSGASQIKLKNYQVTITEIQRLTGLVFDEEIIVSNPLYYSAPETLPAGVAINSYPERIPVETIYDIVSDINEPRRTQEAADDEKEVVITAAMVNPEGSNELSKEWISLLNISDKDVDLKNWTLEDHKGRKIELSGVLEQSDSRTIYMRDYKTIRLPNTGGTIILKNGKGEVIDRESYVKKDVIVENRALRF